MLCNCSSDRSCGSPHGDIAQLIRYEIEKAWGIIAGNVDLVDDMAYKAIASNHQIKILFREHVILTSGKIDKKFDFIMLHGNALKLNEFKAETQKEGGAYIKVSKNHLSND